MVHNLADMLWNPFIAFLEYGTVAYVIGKGLIATLRDVVDFLIFIIS
jgi:hypothetical protein